MYNKALRVCILIGTFVLCFCSCEKNQEITEVQMQEVLSVYKIESPLKAEVDSTWDIEIQNQLKMDYGLNELQREKVNKSASFELCKIKYNGEQEYEGYAYPYVMTSDVIIWKSEDFYAVCKIRSNDITGTKKNPIISDGQDKLMWNENVELVKVMPINQATLLTIGGYATFQKDKDEVGPFTLVESFYIACP